MLSPNSNSTNNQLLISLAQVNLNLNGKTILHDISLELQAGKVLTLIGPNGAGKSTLIKILLGLQKPDNGKVWLKPKLRIGYVPQKISINPLIPLTVKRFVELAGSGDAISVLEEVAVKHLAMQTIEKLSGGEFQRVLLARALLRKPELLILDEPAQGVDVIGQADLYNKISELSHKHGFGIFMVSHDLHLVMQKSDHVLCLNQHICCSGEAEDVSQHPEYQRLFGDVPAHGLAVYTHHHNHCHDLHGNVVDDNCTDGDQHG